MRHFLRPYFLLLLLLIISNAYEETKRSRERTTIFLSAAEEAINHVALSRFFNAGLIRPKNRLLLITVLVLPRVDMLFIYLDIKTYLNQRHALDYIWITCSRQQHVRTHHLAGFFADVENANY
jgi:hypothetical protein